MNFSLCLTNKCSCVCACISQGRTYTFDRVFKPTSTQEKVYGEAAQEIVRGKLLPRNLL